MPIPGIWGAASMIAAVLVALLLGLAAWKTTTQAEKHLLRRVWQSMRGLNNQ